LSRNYKGQLGQWIIPKDLRHLKNCAEIVAAILESESACAAHWLEVCVAWGGRSITLATNISALWQKIWWN
jgi:hypothetical protein